MDKFVPIDIKSASPLEPDQGFYDELIKEFHLLTGVSPSKLYSWRKYHEIFRFKKSNRTLFIDSMLKLSSKDRVNAHFKKLGSRPNNLFIRFRGIHLILEKPISYTGRNNFLVVLAFEYCTEFICSFIYELSEKDSKDIKISSEAVCEIFSHVSQITQLPISKFEITNNICDDTEELKEDLKKIPYCKPDIKINIKNKNSVKSINAKSPIKTRQDMLSFFDQIESIQFEKVSAPKIAKGNRTFTKNQNFYVEDLKSETKLIDSSVKRIK